MDLALYGVEFSPFTMRIAMQLDAKELAYRLEPPPGGLASAEYGALNPIRKLPTLTVDGVALNESEVIAEFLEEAFREKPLRPDDLIERGRMRLLARVADLYVMNPMLRIFPHLDPARRNDDVVGEALDAVEQGLGWLDGLIATGPYALGGTLSVADCAAVPILHFASRFPPMFGRADPVAQRQTLSAYLKAVRQDPVAARTWSRIDDALTARGR